jgi:hypothetical protein
MLLFKKGKIILSVMIIGSFFTFGKDLDLWAMDASQKVQESCLSPQIVCASMDFYKTYKLALFKKNIVDQTQKIADLLYEQMDLRNRCMAVNWDQIIDYNVALKEQISDNITFLIYRGDSDEGFGQGYYMFLLDQNKLIGYGSTYFWSGNAELTFHIFEEERSSYHSLRKGRSKRIMVDVLRRLQDVAHMSIKKFYLPPDQIRNDDAIKFGAVVFYMKIGFVPQDETMYPFYLEMMEKLNSNIRLNKEEMKKLAQSSWILNVNEVNIFSEKLKTQIPKSLVSKIKNFEILRSNVANSI